MIISIILIIISLIALKKENKSTSIGLLVLSLLFAVTSPGWYIILDLNGDLYLALFWGVISLLTIFFLAPEKVKSNNRIFVIFIAFLLWFSTFRGSTRANELFDKSKEETLNVKVVDLTDFGAGRGDFLYYFGYKNTEISCTVLNKDIIFTVPTNSTDKLNCGDDIIVGVRDGFLGVKYCYVIFDENNQVAEQLPQKRTEGRYILHLPGLQTQKKTEEKTGDG